MITHLAQSRLSSASVIVLIAFASAEATAQQVELNANHLARTAKWVSRETLINVYSGWTWDWGQGGAYYQEDGQYYAHTSGSGNKYVATGKWYFSNPGKICVRVKWSNAVAGRITTECLAHKVENGNILQRSRSGEWYVFVHNPPRPEDEYFNFVYGNFKANIFDQLTEEFSRKKN